MVVQKHKQKKCVCAANNSGFFGQEESSVNNTQPISVKRSSNNHSTTTLQAWISSPTQVFSSIIPGEQTENLWENIRAMKQIQLAKDLMNFLRACRFGSASLSVVSVLVEHQSDETDQTRKI